VSEKLSDLFESAQAASVDWDGQLVHSMYELPPLETGVELRIEFDDPNPARPEGLRLKVRGGTLRVADQELDDIVLWSDSAPRIVTAQVLPTKGAASVRVWNCWRDPAGTVQAWIGNAGMLVEVTTDGVVLRCSDGFDDVSFNDLVARIRTLKASIAPE
jgi:hypothetical protein